MLELNTPQQFDEFVKAAALKGRTVFVDFTATWCGPCQRIGPVFERISSLTAHADFCKVDVDENAETAQAAGVRAMPTFAAYKGGTLVDQLVGADPDALAAFVAKHAADKWTQAGEGTALGGQAEPAGMSDQEKRLAALAKRGL